ncbi:MAG: phytoene desaturase family protein [Planctomycetota bacterium]|jgi:phytoene dehydrogenase-like protein
MSPADATGTAGRGADDVDDERCDAVVVGAGIGGLVAAALLARAGRDVLVVDRHSVAGGNATVFRRRDYVFDVGLHYIGGCHAGGVIPTVLEAAGVEPVPFEELDPDGYDTLVLPGLTLRVPRGIERWRDRLCQAFPAERRGVDRYVRLLRQMQDCMDVWHRPGALLWQTLRTPLVARWSRSTFAAFLDGCTRDPLLRAALAAQHVGYALPPGRASTLVAAGIALHYLEGAYYPLGGGQVLSDALVASIGRHGGRIRLRTTARRIVVERGRVHGVELEAHGGGRRLVRAPIVLSNADLKHTLLDLVTPGAVHPRSRRRVAGFVMAPALGVAYLGLNRDLRAEGHAASNYWVLPDTDLERDYAVAADGRLPPRPGAYLTIGSLKDPTHAGLAPAGVTNVQVMAVAPSDPAAWGVTPEQAADGSYRRHPAYVDRKRAFSECLLDTAEAVFPDVRARIDRLEVATPLTHVRYTGATGGTGYGLAATPDQVLWRRPGARTDIRGLFLCGASCRSGHGIFGATLSGLFAADAILPGNLRQAVLGARIPRRPPGGAQPAGGTRASTSA